MLSSHLILCHPLLLLPPIPPSIRLFSSESTLRMITSLTTQSLAYIMEAGGQMARDLPAMWE